MTDGQVANLCEDLLRLLDTTASTKPTRGLDEEESENAQKTTGDELDSDLGYEVSMRRSDERRRA